VAPQPGLTPGKDRTAVTSGPVFHITYWGVTGSVPAPLRPDELTDKIARAVAALVRQDMLAGLPAGPALDDAVRRCLEQLPFPLRSTCGGNTTCVEVRTPEALIVLDCGSGFRELGADLERRWDAAGDGAARSAHVLITHPHLDHLLGIPYTRVSFDPRNLLTLWGARPLLDSLDALFDPASPLNGVYFPLTMEMFKGVKEVREVKPGDEFLVGSTRVRTCALRHPGGCLGYRLDRAGRSLVFATDHEPAEAPDRGLAEFAAGADLLYADAHYLAEEYEGRRAVPGEGLQSRRGWGHGTVESCVATATAAGVRLLHLGHREPRRSDEQLAEVEEYARRLLAEELRRAGRSADTCQVAVPHEGMTVHI
jgi:ribonuclease BN (tRNA processing enzyme)